LDTIEKADALVDDLYRLPIGAIAIDTEYRFASDPVDLGRGKHWYDISTLQPLILTGAAWLPEDNKVIQFLFDLRNSDILPALTRLLRMHTVFVTHFCNAELQTLWSLKLDPVLLQIFDTYVAARALTLGVKPSSTTIANGDHADTPEQAEKAKAQSAARLSLLGQCQHYGTRK
jgi:hypothetical protein